MDPEARAALDLAIRHIEIHADRFLRRDVIEAALRVTSPEVTTFRIAADLQRLSLCRVGVMPTSLRLDRGGPELTSSTALGISDTIALEIDEALGDSVFLLARAEALERLAADAERRHVVLTSDRRAARDLAARYGVQNDPRGRVDRRHGPRLGGTGEPRAPLAVVERQDPCWWTRPGPCPTSTSC